MLPALLLFAAAAIHTDFESGNLGGSAWIDENHVRCAVQGEADQDRRNRQPSWFYFRIDGAAGRDLTIDLADLFGEYNYRKHDGAGLRNTRPVYSYDGRTWRHFDTAEWRPEASTIRLRLRPSGNRVWIARQPPYTTRNLRALLDSLRGHPHFKEENAGATVAGRPIPLLTITNPAISDAKKRVIWLMARQHAWETGTSWVAEGALRWVLSGDAAARRLRDQCVFRIFPMADPDGVARGGVRFNRHGYDLNRNWDAVDAKLMPEIQAQRKAILGWVDAGRPIDLFLTLHNTESTDYIEGPPAVRQLGERFWKLLVEKTSFHSPKGPRDAPETTTPGARGRMTVNQALFHDRKIPAFLMEQMVDASPKLGRCPTVEDRLEFGRQLLPAMADAVAPRRQP